MPTANVVSLDLYRPSTPAQRLRSDRQSHVDRIAEILKEATPEPAHDPLLDQLKDAIERSAARRTRTLEKRLKALEHQLAAALTRLENQGGLS